MSAAALAPDSPGRNGTDTRSLPGTDSASDTTLLEANIRNEIEQLAYLLWVRRGYPTGSPQTDWFEAEAIVRSIRRK